MMMIFLFEFRNFSKSLPLLWMQEKLLQVWLSLLHCDWYIWWGTHAARCTCGGQRAALQSPLLLPSTFTWVLGQTQATRLRQHVFSHPSCLAGPLPPSFQRQGVCPNLQLSDWVMLASQFWGVPGSAEVTVWLAVPAFLWLLGIQTQALMLGPWGLHPLNHAASPSYILFWYGFLILLEKAHH